MNNDTPTPADRANEPWHCRQIPNGQEPIVVCEREDLQAEIERLRQWKREATEVLGQWEKVYELVPKRTDMLAHSKAAAVELEIRRLELHLLAILDTPDPVTRGGHCIFCDVPIGNHVFGAKLSDPSRHNEDCEWIARRALDGDQ